MHIGGAGGPAGQRRVRVGVAGTVPCSERMHALLEMSGAGGVGEC